MCNGKAALRCTVAGCKLRRQRRLQLRLFAFKFFTLNSFEAAANKKANKVTKDESEREREGERERKRESRLNAAQNEANTYVANCALCMPRPLRLRPHCSQMTGGLDACCPCLVFSYAVGVAGTCACVYECVCVPISRISRVCARRGFPLSSLCRCT